ncbi:unnamed protein product [Calicophoron daubneyi]|uniref:Peptidase C1A papain C-terminal domain-containing protein n=1 Tax=Calicophoron daubneyi TaxID=300641 RepID=A0AAV2TIK3_CALDB
MRAHTILTLALVSLSVTVSGLKQAVETINLRDFFRRVRDHGTGRNNEYWDAMAYSYETLLRVNKIPCSHGISTDQLQDCSDRFGNGAKSESLTRAMDYVTKVGMYDQKEYESIRKRGQCIQNPAYFKPIWKLSLVSDTSALVTALRNNRSAVLKLMVDKDFENFKGRRFTTSYDPSNPEMLTAYVTLTGFARRSNGTITWLIHGNRGNSWGRNGLILADSKITQPYLEAFVLEPP